MKTSSSILFMGAAGAALIAAAAAHAEEPLVLDPQATQVAPVIIPGRATGEAPTVLTERTEREELDRRMVQSIEDLGRRVDAGVNFSRQTNSINIRGLDQDRVLTTLDGIRLPWLGRDARGVSGGVRSFDFDSLSSIDIIRGSDSSTAGSGALAGAVALRTLDPESLLGAGDAAGATARIGYDSADESYRANGAFAGRAGNVQVLLGAGWREGSEFDSQGDVEVLGNTRTAPNPAEYDQRTALAKLHYYMPGGHRLSLAADHFQRDETTDVRTQQGQGTSYEAGQNASRDRTERTRVSGAWDYIGQGDGVVERAQAIAYWQRQSVEFRQRGVRSRDARANIIPGDPFRYGFPSGPYGRDNDITEDGYGLVLNSVLSFEGGGVTHRVSLGGDIYRADTEQYSGGFDNCPAFLLPNAPFGPQACVFLHTNQADQPLVEGQAIGLFIEDQIGLMGGRLRITPGLRFDDYEHSPQLTPEFEDNMDFEGLPPESSDSQVSGKLRAEFDPAPGLTVYGQWAQGFRAPTPSELYLRYGGAGSYLRIGDPELEAETSEGFEAGLRLDRGAFTGAISVFHNDYENFIDAVAIDPASIGLDPAAYPLGVTGTVNRAAVNIQGVEANGEWRFAPGWRAWGSVSHVEGEDETLDQPLNSVAPTRAILGVGYETRTWGLDGSFTGATTRDDVANPGADFVAPAYRVVDLIGWWSPDWAEGVRFQAAALNLFDETWWDALSVPEGNLALPADFYTEPGRTLRVSASLQF